MFRFIFVVMCRIMMIGGRWVVRDGVMKMCCFIFVRLRIMIFIIINIMVKVGFWVLVSCWYCC